MSKTLTELCIGRNNCLHQKVKLNCNFSLSFPTISFILLFFLVKYRCVNLKALWKLYSELFSCSSCVFKFNSCLTAAQKRLCLH